MGMEIRAAQFYSEIFRCFRFVDISSCKHQPFVTCKKKDVFALLIYKTKDTCVPSPVHFCFTKPLPPCIYLQMYVCYLKQYVCEYCTILL